MKKSFFVFIIFGLAGAYMLLELDLQQISEGTPRSYPSQVAQRGMLRVTISAFGRFEPSLTADIRQVVAGKLANLTLQVGDRLKYGDVVATVENAQQTLKTSAIAAEIREMEGIVAEHEAEIALRKVQFDSALALNRTGVTTENILLEHQTSFQIAMSRLEQARARLEKLRIDQQSQQLIEGMMTLKSPLGGKILKIIGRDGEYLDPDQGSSSIMTIAKTDVLVLEAMVSEADVLQLAPEMQAQIVLVADQNVVIDSKVRRIRPQPTIVNGATLYVVELEVENKDDRLQVGLTARVDFILTERDNALLVPVSAVAVLDGSSMVAVTDRQTFRLVPVITGLSTRTQQEILSGLAEGDDVLVPFPDL